MNKNDRWIMLIFIGLPTAVYCVAAVLVGTF